MATQMAGAACGLKPVFAAGSEQRTAYIAGGMRPESLPSSELHRQIDTTPKALFQQSTPFSRDQNLGVGRTQPNLNRVGSVERSLMPYAGAVPPLMVCKHRFHIILGQRRRQDFG